jgi:hypothetical protein
VIGELKTTSTIKMKAIGNVVFVLTLFLDVLHSYLPPCDHPIYCLGGPGTLLHTVQARSMTHVLKQITIFLTLPSTYKSPFKTESVKIYNSFSDGTDLQRQQDLCRQAPKVPRGAGALQLQGLHAGA